MIPIQKLAWMAGILDLKGVVIRKRNQERTTPQLVIAVNTKQMSIIRELGAMTGTSPELKKAQRLKEWMRRQCNVHCPEAHVHVGPYRNEDSMMPQTAQWTQTGAAAAIVLFNVLPYMVSDKGFFEVYQEALDIAKLEGRGSSATKASMERLKNLGWDFPPEFEEEE